MSQRPPGPYDPVNPSRRALFKAAGAIGLAAATPVARVVQAVDTVASRDPAQQHTHTFLNRSEAAFLEAAVARLIPGDTENPGAREADVLSYIDRALTSAWGQGAGMYRSGPWQTGVPGQGYQLKFTPAELYRTALTAIDRQLGMAGTPFGQMEPAAQDGFLHKLEKGGIDLDGVPSNVFFDQLLQNTVEGFFSDPMYGGNKDMVGWKAIGFPGAYASWYDLVDRHGIDLSRRQRNPVSIAQSQHHHATTPSKTKPPTQR